MSGPKNQKMLDAIRANRNREQSRKDLVTLMREQHYAPEGSDEDDAQLDDMVEELADEMGIEFDD